MSNISLNNKIFKSRAIILKQLEKRGFNVDNYKHFSLNEIHVLNSHNQLDIFEKTEPEDKKQKPKKCYVKYHLNGKLTKSNIYEFIEDLFNIESVLEEDDDLIIIIKDKMNQTLQSFITNLFFKDNKYVNIYNINKYLFNILEHSMVPPHIPLSLEEKIELEKKYNVIHSKQWPEISRFDPVAQAIGLRPNQLCKIYRKSPTSSISIYYRLCI